MSRFIEAKIPKMDNFVDKKFPIWSDSFSQNRQKNPWAFLVYHEAFLVHLCGLFGAAFLVNGLSGTIDRSIIDKLTAAILSVT
jgi:hypothetical protein